jgi:hypothetical protein
MNEHADHPQQNPLDQTPPPLPPIASSETRKDRIDPDSPDAKSVAPSEGTGVSGNVEPPREEQSWMQDA